MMIDPVGQQLGNYRLVRLLGRGGFADVYLGEHVHLRTQAAIKVLQMRLAEEHAESFINEARTIAHLIHPNIVRVLDFGVHNAIPFLVMDYAPGGTIRRHMPSGRPLPPAGLFPFITQVASALQYAHNRKLMHRDIKPENMLIGVNGEVLLSDFGLALVTQSTSSRGAGGSDFSGTATYMAPEQARGKPRPASDQYALGIVVFEWLTGKRPFEGTFIEVATQQVLAPVPSLREKNPAIPLALEEVVMRAMAKEYQQRFPSVQEFAAALAQACESEGLISAQVAQAAQVVTASSAMPGTSALGNVSQQLTYLQSVQSQGSQQSPNTPHPNIASEGTFLTTSSSDQNYATEMISNLQVSPLSFMQKSSQTLQPPSKGAAEPALSSQKLQQPSKSASSTPPSPQQFGWHSGRSADASAEQTFMMPSSLNNPVLVAKALRRATHINKALLVVSIFLICMLVVGGGAGLYFMHRSSRSVQVPPPINRGTNKGTSIGQFGQDGTAGGKQPALPTPTPQLTNSTPGAQAPNPYLPSMGTLVVNDPLTSNQLKWDDGDSCKIDTKGYYIGVSGPQSTICYAHATDFANFTYEVQMKLLKTDDTDPDAVAVGLVFRGDNDTGASYRIEVTQNSRFIPLICKAADVCTTFDDGQARPITDNGLKQAATAFNRGVEQSNTLAVVAFDNLFAFYINGQEVFSTKQAGISKHGMIGLYLRDNNKDSSAVALFNNVRVWQAS
jgi:serine/threonine protein kinase